MPVPSFHYQDPFPVGKDQTEYYLLTRDHVSVAEFEGKEMLKVSSEGLTLLAKTAMRDVSFLLRPAHQKQVASILHDPEATENDQFVALTMLRNAEVSAKGILPFCQDTGTATV
ncbi:MAG: fumarate hydratase, partial [Bacteroidales bacterium]|nr:fumarate hydratase [Bacteroidales bacterium]